MPFFIDFELQKVTLGPQKSLKFIELLSKIEVSPFPTRVAFWARFWTHLASILGAFRPPRWLKTLLESVLDWPRAVQEHFFSAPEASKSVPRAFQERSTSPWKPHLSRPSLFQSSKSPPRGLQDASRAHLANILAQFWSHFKAILEPCLEPFFAERSSAKGPPPKVPGPAECA